VFAGASAALVTVGVIRYKSRGSKKEQARVVVVPTDTGGFATMSGRF
jgi:hypothetical protein